MPIIGIILEVLLLLWQLPQVFLSLLPLSVFFFSKKIRKFEKYRSSYIIFIELDENVGAFSYGKFIFIRYGMNPADKNEVSMHEYGHSIQSMIFGPFYILVIMLPSILRFVVFYRKAVRASSKSEYDKIWTDYYRGYPENWADKLGGQS